MRDTHSENSDRKARTSDRQSSVGLSRRTFLAASGSAAVASLTGCLGSGSNSGPDEVVFGTLPIAAVGEVFVAEDRGYFEERDIELTVERIQDFGTAIPKLASGDYDVASGSITGGTINAITGGQSVQVIADQTQYWTDQPSANRFWVREGLYSEGMMIDDLPDEFTYPVNSEGGSLDYILGRLVQQTDRSLEDVDIQQMPFTQMVNAMNQGDIDVASIPDPIGLQMGSKANAGFLMYGSQLAPEMQIGIYLSGSPFVENRPDVARRWLEGYVKGIREYYDMGGFQNEEVANIISDAIEIPPEAIRSSVPSLAHKNGRVNADSLLNMQAYYRCRGFVDETVSESELINTELLDEALNNVGELDKEEARPSVETISDWRENALNQWPPVGEMMPPEDFPADTLCQ